MGLYYEAFEKLVAFVRLVSRETACLGPGCQHCEADEYGQLDVHPKTALAKRAEELLKELDLE